MIVIFKRKGWIMQANDTHWEVHVYDSAVEESITTDDEDFHNHENEVHEEEYVYTVEHNLTYWLELKQMEIG